MGETNSESAIQSALFGFFGDLLHQDVVDQKHILQGRARSSDPDAINDVDNKIDGIVSVIQRFQTDAAIRISQLRRQRNILTPIHRLSVDVFNQIFIEAMMVDDPIDFRYRRLTTSWSDSTYYERVLRLAGVCSFWRSIINEHARLWTELDAAFHPSLISTALERSKTSLLSIHYHDYTTWYNPAVVVWKKEFIARVAFSTDRWINANLCVAHSDDLLPLTSTAAPQLRSLGLLSRTITPHTLTLFQRQQPQLDDLRLQGVSLDWSSPIFSGLKVLLLEEIPVFLSLSTICKILQACPELASLSLSPLLPSTNGSDTIPDNPSSHLPKLESLSIAKLSRVAIEFLLSRISAPHCISITIGLEHPSHLAGTTPGSIDVIFSDIVSRWQETLMHSIPQ
ncbi:hypothetical protein FRB99_008112, partial [Tulasnella sp. 403]